MCSSDLLWGLGEQGKLDPGCFRQEGEVIAVEHPAHGVIRARVLEVSQQPGRLASRGERKAASSRGFQVALHCERPLMALGVGWGRHFGAGRLEAVA